MSMAIPDLPLWPFPPNWSSQVLETLEWLTGVLASPIGAEQRTMERATPRKTLEYEVFAAAEERSYLDNLIYRKGAKDFLLPLWHIVHITDAPAASDSDTLPCSTATSGSLAAGDLLFIRGESAFDGRLVEIEDVLTGSIKLTSPLGYACLEGTLLHPVRKVRLTDPPSLRRLTDNALSGQLRFLVTQSNPDYSHAGVSPSLIDSYKGFPVFSAEPDEMESLDYSYERMSEDIDNDTGISRRFDTAGIAFPTQQYRWSIDGWEAHAALYDLLYKLAGKYLAVWVPTFSSDFTLASDAASSDESILVSTAGYTATGGPIEGRRDICFFMVDGTRIYARISESSADTIGETLTLESPLGVNVGVGDVLRISFLSLCRQDRDTVEIAHSTDADGYSSVVTGFRSAPDLRIVEDGF